MSIKSSASNATLAVKGTSIALLSREGEDYICITDIARFKDARRTDHVLQNWLRNRNTIEFLGVWEHINNPEFKPLEFEGFRSQAGLNSFVLTAGQWIEGTGAIGLVSQHRSAGRAHVRQRGRPVERGAVRPDGEAMARSQSGSGWKHARPRLHPATPRPRQSRELECRAHSDGAAARRAPSEVERRGDPADTPANGERRGEAAGILAARQLFFITLSGSCRGVRLPAPIPCRNPCRPSRNPRRQSRAACIPSRAARRSSRAPPRLQREWRIPRRVAHRLLREARDSSRAGRYCS